jgi:hypothetical protein
MISQLTPTPTGLQLHHLTGAELTERLKITRFTTERTEDEAAELAAARNDLGMALAERAAHEVFGEEKIHKIEQVQDYYLVILKDDAEPIGDTDLGDFSPEQIDSIFRLHLNGEIFQNMTLAEATGQAMTGDDLQRLAQQEQGSLELLNMRRDASRDRLEGFKSRLRAVETQAATRALLDVLDMPIEIIGQRDNSGPVCLLIAGDEVLEAALVGTYQAENGTVIYVRPSSDGYIEFITQLPDRLVRTSKFDSGIPPLPVIAHPHHRGVQLPDGINGPI